MNRKLIALCIVAITASASNGFAEVWAEHVIDNSSRGADGVRLADFNRDGLQDIVTGWEEAGVVRLYLNPGPARSTRPWPSVSVGKANSPEDAVAYDVDGDGRLDVVSCHEGKQTQILVHRFTADATDPTRLLDAKNWQTEPFTQLDGQQWMFAAPIHLRDGHSGLVVAAKNKGATVTLLTRPAREPERLSNWSAVKLRDAGWIMTLASMDMDEDGDEDIVFSDRKGDRRGVGWLEQPNEAGALSWTEHSLGAQDTETMFIDPSPNRVLVSTRNSIWLDLQRTSSDQWLASEHPNPPQIPFGKAIKLVGVDTLVMTANSEADDIETPRPGIWMKHADQPWTAISTSTRVKYDRMECIDLDGDGDLDIVTCEERRNLGVVWYENPGEH